jgi:uncharacterized protein (DUF4415 family)
MTHSQTDTSRPPGRPKTNPPQERVNWDLDAEVVEALRAEAEETKTPMKTLVERAVRAHLTERP